MTSVSTAHHPQGIWTTVKQGATFTWRYGGLACQAITTLFFEVLGLFIPKLANQLHIAWLHLTTVWVRVKGALQRHRLEEEIQELKQEKAQERAALVQRIDALAVELRVVQSEKRDEQRENEGLKGVYGEARRQRDEAIEQRVQAELERDLARREIAQLQEQNGNLRASLEKSATWQDHLKTVSEENVSLQCQLQAVQGNREETQRTAEITIAKGESSERLSEEKVRKLISTIQTFNQKDCQKIEEDMNQLTDGPTRILVNRMLQHLKRASRQLTDFQDNTLLYRQIVGVQYV